MTTTPTTDLQKQNEAATLQVYCAACGAQPGKRCRTPAGEPRDSHLKRWTLAGKCSLIKLA